MVNDGRRRSPGRSPVRSLPAAAAAVAAFLLLAAALPLPAEASAADAWAAIEAGGQDAMPELTVQKEVMLVVPGSAGLDVLNFVTVVNSSGVRAPWVALGLPETAGTPAVETAPAEGEEPSPAAAAEWRGGTVVDPTPLEPGESRWYRLEYRVPGIRPPLTVRRPVYFPTEVMEVLVPRGEGRAMGPGLEGLGEQTLGDTVVGVYGAADLEPAAGWRLSIGGPDGGAESPPGVPLVTPRRGFTAFYLPALAVVLALGFSAVKQVVSRPAADGGTGGGAGAGSGPPGPVLSPRALKERRERVRRALDRLEAAAGEGPPGAGHEELAAELDLLERLIRESGVQSSGEHGVQKGVQQGARSSGEHSVQSGEQ